MGFNIHERPGLNHVMEPRQPILLRIIKGEGPPRPINRRFFQSLFGCGACLSISHPQWFTHTWWSTFVYWLRRSVGTSRRVPRHTPNGTSLSKSRRSRTVQLWIPRSVLVVNLAVNRKAGDIRRRSPSAEVPVPLNLPAPNSASESGEPSPIPMSLLEVPASQLFRNWLIHMSESFLLSSPGLFSFWKQISSMKSRFTQSKWSKKRSLFWGSLLRWWWVTHSWEVSRLSRELHIP